MSELADCGYSSGGGGDLYRVGAGAGVGVEVSSSSWQRVIDLEIVVSVRAKAFGWWRMWALLGAVLEISISMVGSVGM